MSKRPWRRRGIRKEQTWSRGLTVCVLILLLLHMGFSLPSGPLPRILDGARPDDPQQGPQQIALPRDQQEEFPFQEAAPFPQFPYRSKLKFFLKPSVLQVEACLLEKIFGPNRVLLPVFEREFQVLLQMGEPDPEGQVEINILGRHWCPKRAKKMIQSLTEKSRRKRYRGTAMLMKPGNRETS